MAEQLGQPPTECLQHINSFRSHELRKLMTGSDVGIVIQKSRLALLEATRRSSLSLLLRKKFKWPNMYPLSGFALKSDKYSCDTEYIPAYRWNGKWYVTHSVTNLPINIRARDWHRNYTVEHIAVDLTALHLVHENFKHKLSNASTFMTSWGGNAIPSAVRYPSSTHEYVLGSAIEKLLQIYDKASQVIDPANIAILALPMTMSLVPAAYIIDINMRGMILFGFFTDVISAMPFLLKGVDLINSNSPVDFTSVKYIGNETLGMIEVLAASCSTVAPHARIGRMFIVTAIIMMVVGLVLEIIAKRAMRERRKENQDVKEPIVEGPFGEALLNSQFNGPFSEWTDREEERFAEMMRSLERRGLKRLRGWPWNTVSGKRNLPELRVGVKSAEHMFDDGYEFGVWAVEETFGRPQE